MKNQRFETFPQSTHNKFQKSCFVWTWRKRALKRFVFSIGILDRDKSCSGKSNRSSSAPIPISPHRTPWVGICGKSTLLVVYIRKNKLFFFSKNYNLRIYDCSYYLSFVLWLLNYFFNISAEKKNIDLISKVTRTVKYSVFKCKTCIWLK